MKHPFETFATKSCCCCWSFDSNVTCFIISVSCILYNAYSGMTNYGIWHWALYLSSLLLFGLHLIAGVVLLVGAYWDIYYLKLIYCWIVFFCLFFIIIAFVLFNVLHKSRYIIWGSKCHGFRDPMGVMIVALNSIWLFAFDFYSSIVVLGNLTDQEECTESEASVFYV